MQRRFVALMIFGHDQLHVAEGHPVRFAWPTHQPLGEVRLRRVKAVKRLHLSNLRCALNGKAIQGFGMRTLVAVAALQQVIVAFLPPGGRCRYLRLRLGGDDLQRRQEGIAEPTFTSQPGSAM